jgi:hypothetical protein
VQFRKGGGLVASIAITAALLAQGAAAQIPAAQDDPNNPFNRESRAMEAGRRVGDIVTQPVRDINLDKTEIPTVLVSAFESPYALQGARTCAEMVESLRSLDAALGPDFVIVENTQESRAGRLAEAGGRTIVNSLIPFRGLVREVSGAAPAERQYNAAVDAGLARRGFIRGLQHAQRCVVRPK